MAKVHLIAGWLPLLGIVARSAQAQCWRKRFAVIGVAD
jgi:hypothetical protein